MLADGTRIDLLRLAGAGEAKALLFCIDGPPLLSPRKLEPILEAFPRAAVFVRLRPTAPDRPRDDRPQLRVVREVFRSAVSMGREALALFVDSAEVERVEAEYRRRDAERLDIQASSGDLHALKERMFSPDNPLAEKEPG